MSIEKEIYIEDEIKASYLDYSMSVIVSRALPDVRDGLKPVHRRILFAMNEMGMTNDKPYKKSARIVGEVLGKYHPHGDTAVYNTMVRMAQEFNYRYMLVQGHGNFGSIDGDSAAAMRYTEARMAKITSELLVDIDKDTIDYRKNFDDSLDEPVVLPAKLPNLLLNGADGIAVGMATKIPPHNLGELVDAIIALIDNKDITIEELSTHIKGPDFPTGGIIFGKKGIKEAYETGRGRILVSGKVDVEEKKNGRVSLIITELPYQVNKARLIEKIANLVKEKRLQGISDLRDESDRDGIRVVIELKKGEEPELILNNLYKYTELQTTFGIIMLALVNNIPRVLNLKEVLEYYLQHRFEVVTRRTRFELNKAEKRAHILEGFRIALDNIDKIIELIRASNDGNTAKEKLVESYSISEIQAKAILDMKLQRLTGLERGKIEAEYNELMKLIIELKEILNNDNRIYEIIKAELVELKEKFNDERRTEIKASRRDISVEDIIKDEKMIVTLTNKGYVKRMALDKYKAQKRGGKGISAQVTIEDDFVESMYVASTLDTLMIFTDFGKAYSLKVYEIPETSRQAKGKLITNLINLDKNEKVRAIIKVRDFSDETEVFFLTSQGKAKKTNLDLFKNMNRSGIIAIKLNEMDNLIYVGLINNEKEEIFVATKKGYAIRFGQELIRSMGRNAAGVKAITLRTNDEVVSGVIVRNEEEKILTITERGYGKRTDLEEYPLQSRGGKGVINIKSNIKTGDVVEIKSVNDDEELMAITSNGIVIRTPVEKISNIGRATQGVKVMRVAENEKVVSIVKVKKNLEDEIDIEEEE
ncbi:DNA gyrase subunit A [Hypnocyclicus thermotrophus]|uniref:DNA gyrase subunit A n=1 Tax=Hypnocyclicus thermotrophus TaxID=1627895 RepID=A0AA46I5W5_9FUSO|nr:DNA gyrase subunit A [Hypnocyclicus thermotrophus]TDT69837.1 DNA gyrase subunit A [Hypnocyclicus thermotrophus]